MTRAWAIVYALILAAALASICAVNQPRPPLIRLATPELATPRTTLIPPVTTTPSSVSR